MTDDTPPAINLTVAVVVIRSMTQCIYEAT